MKASRDHSRYRFRVSCCFVFRFVNSCLDEHGGFLVVLLGWLLPLVEIWWTRDNDSGYSGKTRSVPFYIWIWTTYTLWLPGSLIGDNAGFIQDYFDSFRTNGQFVLGNISNENLESTTGILLLLVFIRSLLVHILESLKDCFMMLLVLCWLLTSGGTLVV